ncbi:MAG TPA: NfeD family protein [Chloroflexaceae bacterium]|nr:NfeD family protein [Chloroflexaceae bacterium]
MQTPLAPGRLTAVLRRGRAGVAALLLAAAALLRLEVAHAGALAQGAAQADAAGPIVALLTNPPVATLLLALGLLLIAADALVGGLGWLSVAGAVLLGLFFWGHAQLGLVGWGAIALVAIGLGLLAAEALLVPGFGVAGLLGMVLLLAGVALSVTDDQPTREAVVRVGWMLLGVVAILTGGLILLVRALPESRLLRGVVLRAKVGAPDESRPAGPLLRWIGGGRLEALGAPATGSTERLSLVGAVGRASSALRPAGVAEIEGRRLDVTTGGEYLGPGEPVEVVRDEGARIVVRRAAGPEREPG